MLLNPTCPCGGSNYLTCCGPYHRGQAAPTAEALMRSRYSAYSQGDLEYLIATLHPRKRRPTDRPQLSSTITHTHWTGLEIITSKNGQPGDRRGTVEFIASYDRPYVGQHHERSKFEHKDDRWYYVEGDTLKASKK
jgi:SEC-C motif domain protein